MSAFWFMLTLLLDVHPLMIMDIIVIKEYRKCPIWKALIRALVPVTIYEVGICITYMMGLYSANVMVGLRVVSALLTFPASLMVFDRRPLQCAYKCLLCLCHTITVIKVSAIGINLFDTSQLPDFMAITCFRMGIYLLSGYPYYLMLRKVLIPSLEVKDDRVWGLFTASQTILNIAVLLTLRSDYATGGIDLQAFIVQLVMAIASVGVTLIMLPAFRMVNDVALMREKEKRDELLLDLSKQQYQAIEANIEHMRQMRHDIKHHIGVLEGLLAEKNYEAMKQYLADYAAAIPENAMKYCAKPSVNALLVYYHLMADTKGVKIDYACEELADCKIAEVDLNILLGNAIENAIEACTDATDTERYIKVCCRMKANQLFIIVDNGFDGVLHMDNNAMLSKKRGFQKTGYGNASMEAVVTKYHGAMKREVKGNSYLLSIMVSQK